MTEGEYKRMIRLLRRGGRCNGKITKANERVAFVVILIAITGFSLENVLRLKFADFELDGENCFLNYQTPRAGHHKRIRYPKQLYQYLEEYKAKYFMFGQEKVFYLNSGYVLRRITETQEEVMGKSGISEIRTFVKDWKNTNAFFHISKDLLMLDEVDLVNSEQRFVSTKSTELIRCMEQYMKQMRIEGLQSE